MLFFFSKNNRELRWKTSFWCFHTKKERKKCWFFSYMGSPYSRNDLIKIFAIKVGLCRTPPKNGEWSSVGEESQWHVALQRLMGQTRFSRFTGLGKNIFTIPSTKTIYIKFPIFPCKNNNLKLFLYILFRI